MFDSQEAYTGRTDTAGPPVCGVLGWVQAAQAAAGTALASRQAGCSSHTAAIAASVSASENCTSGYWAVEPGWPEAFC